MLSLHRFGILCHFTEITEFRWRSVDYPLGRHFVTTKGEAMVDLLKCQEMESDARVEINVRQLCAIVDRGTHRVIYCSGTTPILVSDSISELTEAILAGGEA